jgi:hypothetical protein
MPAPKSKVLPLSLVSNANCDSTRPPTSDELRGEIRTRVETLLAFAEGEAGHEASTFKAFEQALIPKVFELARLLIALFLCLGEERERPRQAEVEVDGEKFRCKPAQARNLNTVFGVVRYWRTYLLGPMVSGVRRGFHPLDVKLGLTADRMSMNLLSLATRLATKLSYAQTRAVLGWFLLQPPSTEVIEQAVLGLGRRTAEWFESAPPPEGDGDVLLILIDSKASPTATEEELQRRRGKRRKSRAKSPRHRGRARRGHYGSKPRRKKGDKSKNGRMATMVVMYTLKRSGRQLLGPINRRFYASFAPKRHAFEIARREADKRGFTVSANKLVQIVTDGDEVLATYAKEFFPGATHTLDVMHALEYLWTAGECLHREGSSELKSWMDTQKQQLYAGNIGAILSELRRQLLAIPPTGPGNKGKRERLTGAIEYLDKRVHQMNYDDLLAADLEIGSGAVEGAIKNIIGARFDKGGMRWIRERAEALLQLRCIEMNGDWERFIERVHDDLRHAQERGCRIRLQQATPAPLPQLAEAA